MNTLHLKEVKVTGLLRLSGHRVPNPFAVVSIDGDSEGAYTTNKIQRTCNPCWNLDITKSFRASSKFCIEVFHTDSGPFRSKTQHLLGKLSIKITDLIENDTSFPLKNESGADKSARVTFKLTIQTDEAANVDSNNADAQVAKALEVAQMVTSWDTPLGRAVQSLEQIMNIVGGLAELHPIAKAAWTILTSVYKVMQRQMYQDDEIRGLAEGLQDTLALVNECSDLRRIKGATDVISEISRAVLEAASLIDEYAQLSLARRTLRSIISVNLSDRIKSCRSRLSELSTKFDRTVAIETRMIVKLMRNECLTKQQIDLLDRLPRVAEAKYDAARCCLADTRKAIIDTIIDWVSKTEDDTKVFWLYGLAGMGKSTIATSVSCALNALGHLGATFFFSRDMIARSSPDQLFSTIAFQMAPIDPSITAGICKALHLDLDIGHSAVANQFEGLIKNPLRDLKDPGHPLVVLLDALDECGSEKQRRGLLAIIQNELPSLPHFVKFIITSRPEADIRTCFMSMGPLVQSFDLSTVQNRLVDADILAFISNRMAGIAQSYDLATDNWPGDDRRHALVQRAAGLFMWASTACEFVDDDQNGGPEEQLKSVLNEPNFFSSSTSPWTILDNLYLQVLQQSVPATASNSRADDLRRIVGSMVAVANPLSPLDLEQLLGMSNPSRTSHGKVVRDILRKLHSVVIVPQADEGTLRIIHPSFVDFITNRNRCIDDRFHIDLPAHRHHLAKRCLMRMQECLRRDICQLGTGPVMNVDIPDRVANFIPGDLRYACCYWAEHLHKSVIDEELYAVVRVFIFEHLLHWFEVMSLMGIHDSTSAILTLARTSLKEFANQHHEDEIDLFLTDSILFAQQFRIPIIGSASQIYISALSFCSEFTLLSKTFRYQYGERVRVRIGAHKSRTRCLATLEGHQNEICAVAVSPDGSLIASGSELGSLQLWDFKTGAMVGLPLIGHSKAISLVAFAPDGGLVASGSRHRMDRTVRIWDPTTGVFILVLSPNDTDSLIATLAFSADGTKLFIGLSNETTDSYDYHLYSTEIPSFRTAPAIKPPVVTHAWTSPQFTIPQYNDMCRLDMALSVTTNQVAILLLDNKIRVFGMMTGITNDVELEIPRGVTSKIINQMAFSPTGSHVAAAFVYHPMIFVWDLQNSTLIYLPNDFDTQSLAFSPDGSHIASGCRCGLVSIWDLSTGTTTMVLQGHNGRVGAMSYSSDGSHVVSGSSDETLRIWDLRHDTMSLDLAEDLDSTVHSVAFSPDGSRCVVATSGQLAAWNSSTSSVISTIPLETNATIMVSFCPSGDRIVAVCRYDLYVWNLDKKITSMSMYERPEGTSRFITIPVSVAVSHTGAHVIVYDSLHRCLCLWDWGTGTLSNTTLKTIGEFDECLRLGRTFQYSLACSSDGKKVVLGWIKVVEVVDASSGEVIHTFSANGSEGSWITSISFSPDGSQIISGNSTGELCLCNITTGLVGDATKVHVDSIMSFIFSSDGNHAILRSRSQQSIVDAKTLLPVDVDAASLSMTGNQSSLHLLRNGWVVDLHNKPIFWVPAENRAYGWQSAIYGSQVILGGLKLTWIDVSSIL